MSTPIALTPFESRLFADLPDRELGELLKSRGLPGRRTETWRWSDLRGALREERAPSEAYAGEVGEAPVTLDGATVITLKNGVPQAPQGVEPKPILVDGEKRGVTYVVEDGLIVSLYDQGRDIEESVAAGEELAAMATLRPLMSISVLPTFKHAVVVRRLSDGDKGHGDNIFITVSEGAQLDIVETHEITGKPFVNSRTEIELDAQSVCNRTIIQPKASDAVLVHTSVLRLDEEKDGVPVKLHQTTLALGAALARHETRAEYLGKSEAKIDALYCLGDRLHNDITTHVTFCGEEAKTDQLVKGIGNGQARGVFQGKFLVERAAQRTDAKMAHHALILSKGAHINAKPELEIYADDVECAHGNTVGALDSEALFYLRQRGLPEDQARAILIDAFGGEVLERVQDETLRDQLGALFRSAV
ncbi:MAG: SufD family Fe-S cluster assembly protein [Pseudomonadota bacterium]